MVLTSRAGFGESIITPPDPYKHHLAGYIERRGLAAGVHDNIYAKVAYIESLEGDALVIINLELLAVDERMFIDLRDLVMKKLGRDVSLLISATHTHSAPATLFRSGLVDFGRITFNKEYYRFFIEKVERALEEAINRASYAEVEIWVKLIGGVATDRNDPRKKIDNQAISLIFKKNGVVEGAIVNYAIHPTVLGPNNLYISSDLVGFLTSGIKRFLKAGSVLFINGAAANISTRFTRKGRGFDEAQRLGEMIAEQILNPDLREPLEIRSIKRSEKTVSLKIRDLNGIMLRSRLLELRHFMDLLLSRGSKRRLAESKLEGIKAIKRYAEYLKRNNMKNFEIDLLVLALDKKLSIIAVPLELDSTLSLELKASSPFKYNILACYTNGYIGYLTLSPVSTYEGLVQLIDPLETLKLMGSLKEMLINIDP